MKGRRPASPQLKALRGQTASTGPLMPPQSLVDGEMECPDWLTGEGRAQWSIVTGNLREMGLLSLSDTGLIAAYCLAISRLKSAQEDINANGLTVTTAGGVRKNPSVAISEKATDAVRQLSGELGLCATGRHRLSVSLPKPDDGKKKFFFGTPTSTGLAQYLS